MARPVSGMCKQLLAGQLAEGWLWLGQVVGTVWGAGCLVSGSLPVLIPSVGFLLLRPPSDLDSTCSVPLPWQAAFMYTLTNSLCQILSLSYQRQLLKYFQSKWDKKQFSIKTKESSMLLAGRLLVNFAHNIWSWLVDEKNVNCF